MKTKMKAMLLLALLALLFVLPLSTAMAAVPAVYLGAPVENADGTWSFTEAYIPDGDTGTIVQLVVLDHSITLTKVQKQDILTGDSTLYPVYKDEAGTYCYKVGDSYKLADGNPYTGSPSELTPVMVYPEYVPTMTLPTEWTRNESLSGYGFNVYDITAQETAKAQEDVLKLIKAVKYETETLANKARFFLIDGDSLNPIEAKTHYNPKNQHFYQYVESDLIDWDEAWTAAQQTFVLNRGGYLAAIDAPSENDFIAAFMTSGLEINEVKRYYRIWLGGTRAKVTQETDVDGNVTSTTFNLLENDNAEWWWRTEPNGPQDYHFYTGIDKDDETETHTKVKYTRWTNGEPNNSVGEYDMYEVTVSGVKQRMLKHRTNEKWHDEKYLVYNPQPNVTSQKKIAVGDEMYLHLYGGDDTALWNDDKVYNYQITGYIVEFGDIQGNTYDINTGKEEESDTKGDTSDNQTLTLNANGGKFTNGTDTYTMQYPQGFGLTHGTTENVEIPTRDNYTFKGWYGDKDCEEMPDIAIQEKTGEAVGYAGWLPHNTVTLKLDGGKWADNTSIPRTKAYHDKLAATERTLESMYAGTVPVKEGYTFAGWKSTDDGSVLQGTDEPTILPMKTGTEFNEPITTTYTATWTANSYTLQLDPSGGKWSDNTSETKGVTFVYDGAEVDLTASEYIPTRAGYRFEGWFDSENNEVETFDSTSLDETLTAKWSDALVYDISYILGGGTADPVNVTSYTVESAPITLTNPTKPGYTFAGWEGTGIDAGTTSMSVTIPTGSTGNRNYTATWTANSYTLQLDPSGGKWSDNTSQTKGVTFVYDGAEVDLTASEYIPTRAGYRFEGWFDSENNKVETFDSTSLGETLTAKWSDALVYDISYDLDGGVDPVNVSSYTVESAPITLTNPTKPGYTFAGWKGTGIEEGKTSMSVTIATGSTGDRTYTATWTAKSYTITLDMCGVTGTVKDAEGNVISPLTLTHTYDAPTTLPNAVTENDDTGVYTFVEWVDKDGNAVAKTDGVQTVAGKAITADTTYYAKWEKKVDVSVTWVDGNDADGNRAGVEVLLHLFNEDYSYDYVKGIPKDTTATVSFEEVPVHDFNGTFGSGAEEKEYSEYQYHLLAVKDYGTFTGTFNGYTPDVSGFDVTLTRAPAMTGTHKVVIAWDDDQNRDNVRPTSVNVTLNNDASLAAKKQAVSSSTGDEWTYDFAGLQLNHNTNNAVKRVVYAAEILDKDIPAGYTISKVEDILDGSNIIGQKITLTHGLTTVDYAVQVDWNDDNNTGYRPTSLTGWKFIVKDSTPEQASGVLTLEASSSTPWFAKAAVPQYLAGKNGVVADYSIKYVVPEGFTVTSEQRQNNTYTIQFKPATYGVTYNPAGGTMPASSVDKYTYGIDQPLPVPTKAGYAFTGWKYKDPENNNNEQLLSDNKIPGSLTGDLDLTATWGLNTYTLTLDAQGGTVSTSSISYTYETPDDIDLSSYVPVRGGYKFMGWYTDKNGAGTKVETYSTKQESKTLYAAWSLQYAINYELFDLGAMPGTEPVTYVTEEGASFIDEMQAGTVWTVYPTPAAGYTFDGWYADNAYTGSAVKGIASGSTGDVTVYARWKKNITALGEWNDGDDAYGHRADTNLTIVPITENLPAALVTTQKQVFPKNVTLDQTPVEFTGLDALYKGEPIAYKVIVKEEDLPFDYLYIEGVEKYQYLVTLSCPANPYYFTTKIVWEDEDDAHNFRPDEVKVQFIGTEAYEGQKWNQPFVLDDSNGWGQSKTVPDFKARVMITTQIIDADQYKDHYVITESMVEEDQNHGTKTFTFSCKECKKPVIIKPTQEIDVDGLYATDCTLEVEALNATSYQWYEDRGDGKGWRKIDGATGCTHTLSLHDHTFRGYRFKCEAINQYGTAMSAVMNLNYIYADLPNTGDGSNLLLWGGLLAASGAAAALLMKKRKR